MKSSEILREAARLIECGRETFSCHAIASAEGLAEVTGLGRGHNAYRVLLGRLPTCADIWVGANRLNNGYATVAWGSDVRIMALCLAAAIAESEGD